MRSNRLGVEIIELFCNVKYYKTDNLQRAFSSSNRNDLQVRLSIRISQQLFKTRFENKMEGNSDLPMHQPKWPEISPLKAAYPGVTFKRNKSRLSAYYHTPELTKQQVNIRLSHEGCIKTIGQLEDEMVEKVTFPLRSIIISINFSI